MKWQRDAAYPGLWLPAYGNTRRHDRRTTGDRFAKVAKAFGVTPKPFQQYTADLFGEINPDTGLAAYSTLTLGVGRRAGKTLLEFLYMLGLLFGQQRDRRIFFTQQTHQYATLTMRTEWLPIVNSSPMASALTVRLSNGDESLTRKGKDSFIRLFAPRPNAMHSQATDLVIIDEAWEHSLDRGRELEIAVKPTQYTRPGAQLIVSSAAGDSGATWWAERTEVGREQALEDRGTGHLHLEWTGDVEGVDPEDRSAWRKIHPGGLPLELLEDEYRSNPAMFRRTILNIADLDEATSEHPLDLEAWQQLATTTEANYKSEITLGIDVTQDQTAGSIVACLDQAKLVQLVDHHPGIDWIIDQVISMCDRYDIPSVALDPRSPAGVLVPALERAGVPLRSMALGDICVAAAGFREVCRTGSLRHIADPSLDAAVEGVRRRSVADGAWTFSRKNSEQDPTPIIAASMAWWAHPEAHGAGLAEIY